MYGVYHMFCASKVITNTEHTKDSRILLRRLVTYLHHVLVRGGFSPHSSASLPPHAPDVRTLQGTIDLFLLCIFAELGELLDHAAYRKQRRDVKELEEERLCVIYVRGLSRDIRAWWSSHLMFSSPAAGSIVSGEVIYKQLLSHQIAALVGYKKDAERRKMEAEEASCTGVAFEALARRYFPFYPVTPFPPGATLKNFEWEGGAYTIARSIWRKQPVQPYSCESIFDPSYPGN